MFNGYRVSVWKDEQVLEMDGDDGSTTMSMYLMPQGTGDLKAVNLVNFVMYFFTTITKNFPVLKQKSEGVSARPVRNKQKCL